MQARGGGKKAARDKPLGMPRHEGSRQAVRGKARRLRRGERRRDSQQRGDRGLRQDDAAMRGAKISSDEKGKRRKKGQYVRDELGIRRGEEREIGRAHV